MSIEYELLLVNVLRSKRKYHTYLNDCIGQHLIAEYVKKGGFRAKVYSGCAEDAKNVIDNEVKNRGVGVVGFYIAFDNLVVTKNIIKSIKNKFHAIKIIAGGPQVIAFTGCTLEEYLIDYAIIGEGEKAVLRLLEYLVDGYGKLETIPSLRYYKDGKYRENVSDGASIQNIDEIPFPKYENSLNRNFRMGKTVGIITGRGCPFSCAFCYEGACSKNVRFRSIDNVMQEIDYIKANNPQVDTINIYDDTFTFDKARLSAFCREIKKRGLKWYCEGHVAYLSKNLEVIPLMIDSGLIGIQLGIESGSQNVLSAYNKKITPNEIITVVKKLKDAGVANICGNLIIGGAIETEETLNETLNLGKKLIEVGRGVIEITTVYFAPYPHTDMVMNPEKYQIQISDIAFLNQIESMRGPVVRTSGLSMGKIWNARSYIDNELQREYVKQAYNINRRELIQGLFADYMPISTNNVWKNIYLRIEHLRIFLEHIGLNEQMFRKDYYPMRTCYDCVVNSDQSIITRVGIFEGKKAKFLILSNGKYTAAEIQKIMNISIAEIEELYNYFNEKCLVYMSEF